MIRALTDRPFQFNSADEILVRPDEDGADANGRSKFTVCWIDGDMIHCQNRHDNIPHYIHRITHNSKRPCRFV